MRIAFATFTGLPDGREDDREAAARLGAQFRVWNDPEVDWELYDRVVIRSTWDYTLDREAFLTWTRRVGRERLRNPPELIAWNTDKVYLDELSAPTVPTAFVRPDGPRPPLLGEVVVKPNVSAGAVDTGRFPPERHGEAHALITRIQRSGRTALLQPYLSSVDAEGETALVFLGGTLSHVLHKRAVLRDPGEAPLAVDDPVPVAAAMHDPELVEAGSADADERRVGEAVLREVADQFGLPVYLRVDLVRGVSGEPVVMEIEATEPCLYLEQAPGAPERLAAAVLAS